MYLYWSLYWSGSGCFLQQAKKWRNILISTVLWLLFDCLSLKNDVFVSTLKRNKQKNLSKEKNIYCWHLEGHWRKEQDLEPDPHPDPLVKGTDPDPRKNIMDPERCLQMKLEYCSYLKVTKRVLNERWCHDCRNRISPRRSSTKPSSISVTMVIFRCLLIVWETSTRSGLWGCFCMSGSRRSTRFNFTTKNLGKSANMAYSYAKSIHKICR
jgi:hypothetical protein